MGVQYMARIAFIFRQPLLIWFLCLSLGLTALSPTVIAALPMATDSPTTRKLFRLFQTGTVDSASQSISPTAIGNVDALANVPLKGWTPSLNDAQVDRFSGAFSWDYDFDLPNGPAGIKPELHLTYNSRRMDGLWGFGQSDWVGFGWSLDVPEITRPNVHTQACDIGCSTPNEYYIHRDNDYMLTLSGQSSRMVSVGPDLWRMEDDRFARITHLPGDAWEVALRDGTRLLLGTSPDSKVTVHGAIGNQFTTTTSAETLRYRIKQMVFTTGASAIFTYSVDTASRQCGIWTSEGQRATNACLRPIFYENDSVRASYLTEISYPGTRIVFNRSRRWDRNERVRMGTDGARVNAYWYWNVADERWPIFFQTDVLRSVDLLQQHTDGTWETTRRWRLTYGGFTPADCRNSDGTPTNRFGCPTTTTDEFQGLSSINMRVLSQFQVFAIANGHEAAQPAYTFGYLAKPNKDQGGSYYDQLQFVHPRLANINNGQMAQVQAAYDTPDGGANTIKYYRVTRHDVQQTGGALLRRTTFEYSPERCFSQGPPGYACDGRGSKEIFHGYRAVTSTVSGADNISLKREVTHFSFGEEGFQARGRATWEEIQEGDGRSLQRVTNTWSVSKTLGVAAFVGLNQRDTLDVDGGRIARTAYRYDAVGNLRATLESGYLDVDGDERSTLREFFPSTGGLWMLDRVAHEAVFQGLTEDINSPRINTQTHYFYDEADNWQQPPTSRGVITRLDRGPVAAGWASTHTSYDGWGNPIDITDPNGGIFRMQYDALSRFKLSETNALGQQTRFELIGINTTLPIDGAAHFGHLTRSIDPNGAATQMAYDEAGRMVDLIRPLDNVATPTAHNGYDRSDWPLIFAHAFDSNVDGWFSQNGPALSWAAGQGRNGTGGLHVVGNTSTGLAGRFYLGPGIQPQWESGTTYRLSAWVRGAGNVCFSAGTINANPALPITCMTATASWQRMVGTFSMPTYAIADTNYTALLVLTAANGADVYLDDIDISKVTDAPIKVIQQQRERHGCATCTIDTFTFYDPLGRVVQTRAEAPDNQQRVADIEYDALDRTVRSYQPVYQEATEVFSRLPGWDARPRSQTTYDALDRSVTIVYGDGSRTQTQYAASDMAALDANGHLKIAKRNGLGQLIESIEVSGTFSAPTFAVTGYAVARYSYDALDHLLQAIDPIRATTLITYNQLGYKTDMLDPDSGTRHFDYDLNGNVLTQTDALGNEVSFVYDKLNRMTQRSARSPQGSLSISHYIYDEGQNGIGRRTSASNENAAIAYRYDARGRLIYESRNISGGSTYGTTYEYDAFDRVTRTALPSGEVLTTAYDAAGRPLDLHSSSINRPIIDHVYYSAIGKVREWQGGNGALTSFDYGLANQRLQRLRVTSIGSLHFDWQFGYDNVGNVTGIVDGVTGERQGFGYDPLDRLTRVTGPASEEFSYDPSGNLLQKAASQYRYGDWESSHTRPHAVTHVDGSQTIWYDLAGNMNHRMDRSGTFTQTWDAENRLTAVISQSARSTYFYGPDGELVKRATNEGSTLYINAQQEIFVSANLTPSVPPPTNLRRKQYLPNLAAANPNSADLTTYYRLGSQTIAIKQGGTMNWLHVDHLGSVSLVTGRDGQPIGDARYRAFGELLRSTGTLPGDKRYAGKPNSDDTGLQFYGARFYASGLGRFISPDPVNVEPGNPSGLNRYAFVNNNPLGFVDPTGYTRLCAEGCDDPNDRNVRLVNTSRLGLTCGVNVAVLPCKFYQNPKQFQFKVSIKFFDAKIIAPTGDIVSVLSESQAQQIGGAVFGVTGQGGIAAYDRLGAENYPVEIDVYRDAEGTHFDRYFIVDGKRVSMFRGTFNVGKIGTGQEGILETLTLGDGVRTTLHLATLPTAGKISPIIERSQAIVTDFDTPLGPMYLGVPSVGFYVQFQTTQTGPRQIQTVGGLYADVPGFIQQPIGVVTFDGVYAP